MKMSKWLSADSQHDGDLDCGFGKGKSVEYARAPGAEKSHAGDAVHGRRSRTLPSFNAAAKKKKKKKETRRRVGAAPR